MDNKELAEVVRYVTNVMSTYIAYQMNRSVFNEILYSKEELTKIEEYERALDYASK